VLTNSSGDNQNPSWSRDGKRIAFESTRDNESAIYVMNANGSSQHRVS
jgi:TolB protein